MGVFSRSASHSLCDRIDHVGHRLRDKLSSARHPRVEGEISAVSSKHAWRSAASEQFGHETGDWPEEARVVLPGVASCFTTAEPQPSAFRHNRTAGNSLNV
jgi:hypothetical protein